MRIALDQPVQVPAEPEAPVEPETPVTPTIEDGKYTINMWAMRLDNENVSSADQDLVKPAKLEVSNGKIFAYITMTRANLLFDFGIPYIDAENLPKVHLAEVVAEDLEGEVKTRTYKIEVPTLENPFTVQTSVDRGRMGTGTVQFRLVFLQDSLQKIESTDPVVPPSEPENNVIDIPAQFKATASGNQVTLQWAAVVGATYEISRTLNGSESIISNITGTSYVDTVHFNTSYTYKIRAVKNNHHSLWSEGVSVTTGANSNPTPNPNPELPDEKRKDGEYSIDFTVKKDNSSERSVMAEYVVSPAKLTVKNGKSYVAITVKNSSWVTAFQVNSNGSGVTVVSTDRTADSRVIQFEVLDLSKKVDVYTEAKVPEINYSGKYNVQLQFDVGSIRSGYVSTPVTSQPSPVAAPKETLITVSDGGTVEFSGAVIHFPQNAFTSNFNVKVEKVTNPSQLPLADKTKLASDVFEITKDKTGSFEKQVTITLPFDGTKVDLEKYELSIYWFDEQKKEWIELDNVKVDASTGKVSGDVDHFTKFAIIAKEKQQEKRKEENKEKESVTEEKKEQARPIQDRKLVHFSDIEGHWAEESIKTLASLGAIQGYPDGTFKPSNQMTRAEFITVVVRAFHLEERTGKSFSDTTNHWAKHAVETAYAHGLIQGYDENHFGPNDAISREQMAVILVRAAKLAEKEQGKTAYTDQHKISSWASSAVQIATGHGVITGYPDGSFKPKNKATRAEAVTMIVRTLK